MTEETQTQFKTEGQKPFENANTEKDDSATSSTEKTNSDQTQSQEGDQNSSGDKKDDTEKDNFADHPRWKEREEDWKNRFNDQEKRHTDEITKLREEFLGKGSDKTESTPEIPPWFGGDADQWKQFLAWNNEQVIAKAKELALSDIQSKSQEEQKKLDEATTYMNNEIAALEADKTLNPQGQQIDRNKLLKVVLDNELVDTQGRWNYRAAFKIMKPADVFKAKEALNERKQVAAATTSENRAESKPKAFLTNQDFKKPENRPW